jgi:hypothetical protein
VFRHWNVSLWKAFTTAMLDAGDEPHSALMHYYDRFELYFRQIFRADTWAQRVRLFHTAAAANRQS